MCGFCCTLGSYSVELPAPCRRASSAIAHSNSPVGFVELTDRLAQRGFGALHISRQLIRCGTSIGANAEEAQEGQTKADFIAKMCISRKEARETIWWLRLAIATRKVTAEEVNWELSEANQLLAMIKAAVRTARSSQARGVANVILLALGSLLLALSSSLSALSVASSLDAQIFDRETPLRPRRSVGRVDDEQ